MKIEAKDHNIQQIFNGTKYYIDFYQREYTWTKRNVTILLDDIFAKFDLNYNETLTYKPNDDIKKLGWYYLNTYITSKPDDKTYIIDGQQRLTTITLILIQLYILGKKKFEEVKLSDYIKKFIFGDTNYGSTNEYYMGDRGRDKILDRLFNNKEDDSNNNISAKNMYQYSKDIAKYLENNLCNQKKYDAFTKFFITNIILINIFIEEANDVPMVFEVINK